MGNTQCIDPIESLNVDAVLQGSYTVVLCHRAYIPKAMAVINSCSPNSA